MAASFSKEDRRLDLLFFYTIINGLAQVPFEGVLVEAYKGTRRKHPRGAQCQSGGHSGVQAHGKIEKSKHPELHPSTT